MKPKKTLLLSSKDYERILVEIRDYPGTWLIDIPMVEMSYQQWCESWASLIACPSRKQRVKPFLDKVRNIDPLSPFSEDQFNELYLAFHHFNFACREAGLTVVQPGQLLLRAGIDARLTPFIPLPSLDISSSVRKGQISENSWLYQLQQRYDSYVNDYIKPFIARSINGVDRQLVLIDVITALSQGAEALEDVQQALIQVLQTFSYGRNNVLLKMMNPSIDRLTVVATKVDQVLPGQHDNVRRLTSALLGQAYRKAAFCNILVSCEAIASVRSSVVKVRQG